MNLLYWGLKHLLGYVIIKTKICIPDISLNTRSFFSVRLATESVTFLGDILDKLQVFKDQIGKRSYQLQMVLVFLSLKAKGRKSVIDCITLLPVTRVPSSNNKYVAIETIHHRPILGSFSGKQQ
jgi:hypothetical protein